MITADRFPEFVDALYGGTRSPFPWQQRLADAVLADGVWPEVLDVPTALGKTSVLDIALLATAQAVQQGTQPRRRVFFVVDRRLVVDEAHEHALTLQERLTRPDSPILKEVSKALQRLSPGDASATALDVTRMRGGTTWDWRWVRRPDRPGIVTGTVDQVGSRLLFRGYGVSDRRRSIDAAMVGLDSLILVDEAHLADALLETVRAVQRLDQPVQSVRDAAKFVRLSATPRHASESGSSVAVFDLGENLGHQLGRRRLMAPKTLQTVECPPKQLPALMAEAVRQAVRETDGRLVSVVANTVTAAREVARLLRTDVEDESLLLLTGRSRPLDRERLLADWLPRLTLGWREAETSPSTRVLIATQTVEVGANFDFDVLITESAAWDALVQRLGRVNRDGKARAGQVVVVHPVGVQQPVVYGEATTQMWSWLSELVPPDNWGSARAVEKGWSQLRGGLDVSPAALRALSTSLSSAQLEQMSARSRTVPAVLRQHVECWVRTGPVPDPDVPVHPFLHGFDSSPEPVRLVWRGDLTPAQLVEDALPPEVAERLRSMPPRPEEIIEVSASAVRAWLSDGPMVAVSDTDVSEPDDDLRSTGVARPGVWWHAGPDGFEAERVHPAGVRPGQLLVMPVSYGGCDRFGWDPRSTLDVIDVADLAAEGRRRTGVFRLDRGTLLPLVDALSPAAAPVVRAALDQLHELMAQSDSELPSNLPPVLEGVALVDVEQALLDLRRQLDSVGGSDRDGSDPWMTRWHIAWRSAQVGRFVLTPNLRLVTSAADRSGDDESREGSSSVGRAQILAEHSDEVAAAARTVALALGLAPVLTDAVTLAARWHDLGKVEPRFQAMLHGGRRHESDRALAQGLPLAKSGMLPTDTAVRRAAARDSGYPSGGRHEEMSLVIARARLSATSPSLPLDEDLVLHLIASHHGHSRPLLPPVSDPERPASIQDESAGSVALPLASVDWTHPDRFHALNERYGRWGLALLESIVRLADIACSASEHDINSSS